MSTAALSLRVAQGLIETVKGNIEGAKDIHRTRRETVVESGPNGKLTLTVYSPSNESLDKEVRSVSTVAAGERIKDEFLSRYVNTLGQFGAGNTAPVEFTKAMNAIDSAAKNPGDESQSLVTMQALGDFCNATRVRSSAIQGLRLEADESLVSLVQEANDLLKSLETINTSVIRSQKMGDFNALDLQNKTLNRLSELLPITTLSDEQGRLTLTTSGGRLLFQSGQASTLSFNPGSVVDATITRTGGFLSGITLNRGGTSEDITDILSSGSLRALVTLRDDMLPMFQDQFDEVMTGFANTLNARQALGISVPPQSILQGVEVFANGGATAFVGTGTWRVGILNNDKTYAAFADINLTGIHTLGDLCTAINATGNGNQLRAEWQLDHTLRVRSVGGEGIIMTPTGGPATETATGRGLAHFLGLNTLLINGTKPIGANRIGVSSGMTMNPSIQKIALATPDQTLNPIIGTTKGYTSDDGTNGASIARLFSDAISFQNVGGFVARTISVTDFLTSLTTYQTVFCASVSQSLEGKEAQLKTLADLRDNLTKVDVDEEKNKLMDHVRYYNSIMAITEVLHKLMRNVSQILTSAAA